MKEYKALVCVPSNRQLEYTAFTKQVKEQFQESKRRYGAVKICRALNNSGIPCSLKRVQRHMVSQELTDFIIEKGKNRFPDPDAAAKAIQKAARSSYRLPKTVNHSVNQAQLAKYAGLAWLQHQSGDFEAQNTRLIKSGSRF